MFVGVGWAEAHHDAPSELRRVLRHGRLLHRALAARPGPDGQDAELVGALAADPLVGAGAAGQRDSAVLADRDQAGLRVELLRAGPLRVRDL